MRGDLAGPPAPVSGARARAAGRVPRGHVPVVRTCRGGGDGGEPAAVRSGRSRRQAPRFCSQAARPPLPPPPALRLPHLRAPLRLSRCLSGPRHGPGPAAPSRSVLTGDPRAGFLSPISEAGKPRLSSRETRQGPVASGQQGQASSATLCPRHPQQAVWLRVLQENEAGDGQYTDRGGRHVQMLPLGTQEDPGCRGRWAAKTSSCHGGSANQPIAHGPEHCRRCLPVAGARGRRPPRGRHGCLPLEDSTGDARCHAQHHDVDPSLSASSEEDAARHLAGGLAKPSACPGRVPGPRTKRLLLSAHPPHHCVWGSSVQPDTRVGTVLPTPRPLGSGLARTLRIRGVGQELVPGSHVGGRSPPGYSFGPGGTKTRDPFHRNGPLHWNMPKARGPLSPADDGAGSLSGGVLGLVGGWAVSLPHPC